MAENDDAQGVDQAAPKSRRALTMGLLVMTLLLGGGGFYATWAGLVGGGGSTHAAMPAQATPTYLELDTLQVSVGGEEGIRQLRFRAFLEVGPDGRGPVEAVMPRMLDIFATYLRAVPIATLEDPTALVRIRAQLLHRIRLLTGEGQVEDLLIVDFVVA